MQIRRWKSASEWRCEAPHLNLAQVYSYLHIAVIAAATLGRDRLSRLVLKGMEMSLSATLFTLSLICNIRNRSAGVLLQLAYKKGEVEGCLKEYLY